MILARNAAAHKNKNPKEQNVLMKQRAKIVNQLNREFNDNEETRIEATVDCTKCKNKDKQKQPKL